MLKNVISGNTSVGLLVHGAGTFGLVKDNDISGSPCGVAVEEGAAPSVVQNRVYHTRDCAVRLSSCGAATVRENEIFDNEQDGHQAVACAPQVGGST